MQKINNNCAGSYLVAVTTDSIGALHPIALGAHCTRDGHLPLVGWCSLQSETTLSEEFAAQECQIAALRAVYTCSPRKTDNLPMNTKSFEYRYDTIS